MHEYMYERMYVYMYIYLYRVSIKSFPDYKHLLQENYVEYEHIVFQNVTQLNKFFYN
jgi:hypothetical protein